MKKILNILNQRKEQLKKECWSNKIRINEIETIIDIVKKTPVVPATDVNEEIKEAVNQLLRIEGKEQLF